MLFHNRRPRKKKKVYFTINRSGLPVNSAESQHLSYSLQYPEILFPLLFSCHCLFCCIVSLAGLCCLYCAWGQHHEKGRRRGGTHHHHYPLPRPGEGELPPLPSARRPARPLRGSAPRFLPQDWGRGGDPGALGFSVGVCLRCGPRAHREIRRRLLLAESPHLFKWSLREV